MQEETKRAQMQDVLQQIGYVDDEGRAVVEDHNSRAIGPDGASASVIKILCEALDAKLQTVGLVLAGASIGWRTDESAEQVYAKLRNMQLIPDSLVLAD